MKNILIIQTAFIGDVILSTPVIEKLHQAYPDCNIDFLLRKGNEDLLTGHPKIRRLFILDKKQHKIRNVFNIIRELRKTKYDRVINLQRFFTTGMITFFLRADFKAGFKKNPLSFFYNRKVSHEIGNGEHEISRNIKVIEDLVDNTRIRPSIYPSRNDHQKVQQYKHEDYICIAPTSVWYTKQFPPEKWLDMLGKLPERYVVFLLGAPDDYNACQNIINKSSHKQIFNLAGELSLKQTASLMRDAAMNYVNDSAPLHLASAMNAPVTAIFCSTVPRFGFFPVSDHSTIVETTIDLDCRPCGLHGYNACPLGHFKCAYTINTAQLLPKS
ncbi:MAG: glycosyltransferase family 9 protein [Bacteroidota bacterium]